MESYLGVATHLVPYSSFRHRLKRISNLQTNLQKGHPSWLPSRPMYSMPSLQTKIGQSDPAWWL